MKVLMAAAEAVPFAKTGGLADVIGALPPHLQHLGVETRLVLPGYAARHSRHRANLGSLTVPWPEGSIPTRVLELEPLDGVRVYAIDAPAYFDRPELYGYDDDILRFGYFSRAVTELATVLSWTPDVVHLHDWHTGLVPVYAHLAGHRLRTVFSIHNLAFQGTGPAALLPRLGLPAELFNLHELEFYGQLNCLKGGLVFSDRLTTVSPQYAREIQTPEFGCGLNTVLAARGAVLTGIRNGIDHLIWHPTTDPFIPVRYSEADLSGKQACREALLAECGFKDRTAPLAGMVSRVTAQKGFDLLYEAIEDLLALGLRLVLLGAGNPAIERQWEKLQQRFPQQVSVHLGKRDEGLAHRIYAGSDLFLMPSHFEPCGLSQMIAAAYGTVPLVRATGGLADTITEWNPRLQEGNGFVFHDYSAPALVEAVRRAVQCYATDDWSRIQQAAMQSDFSWATPAAQYAELFQDLVDAEAP